MRRVARAYVAVRFQLHLAAVSALPYYVYQLFWRQSGRPQAYKYGITRVGASRPKGQIRICEKYTQGLAGLSASQRECQFEWLRRNVKGWFAARSVEAGYIATYKARTGHCPPGQFYSCR